jgi:hypothetical protein
VFHLLHDWFGWPDGSVLTNLVASAICVGVGVWRLVKSHRALHAKLDRLHKHLGVPPE